MVLTGATSGIMTAPIQSLIGYQKPQFWNKLSASFGDQHFDGIIQMSGALDRMNPVPSSSYSLFEENRYERPITVYAVSTTTPGIGGPVTITLPAADHEASGTRSFPRQYQDVLCPGEIPCWISAKSVATPNAHTITISPVDASDNIGDLTGQVIFVYSSAKASGTGQGDSTILSVTQRDFVSQIIWDNIGAEGTTLAQELWVDVLDDGRNLAGYYHPGITLLERRWLDLADGACTWSKENTNSLTQTTARGSVNPVNHTKGFVPWITALGKNMSITAGNYDVNDGYTMGIYFKQQGVTSPIGIGFVGDNLRNDINEACFAKIDGNGTDYTKVTRQILPGISDELAMSINFKAWNVGDYSIVLKTVPAWINPMSYGMTNFNMSQMGIFGPIASYADAKNPGQINKSWDVKYKAKGNYSRRLEIWNTGGAGGPAYYPYNTDVDEVMINARGEIMFTMCKANQWIIQRPA